MKEVNEAWEWLKKFATEDERKRFRPVYQYVEKLEKHIENLEKKIAKYNTPSMFSENDRKLQLIQENIAFNMKKKEEKPIYAPLPLRLKIMYENNLKGSKEWDLTLRFNQLTEEQAIELVKNEQAKNGQ